MKELFEGKAKELFEEYFSIEIHTNGFEALEHHLGIDVFYSFPLSMQIGVVEDFAYSINVQIWQGLNFGLTGDKTYYAEVSVFDEIFLSDHYETKKEAREALIKELNKIINERETNIQ